MIYIYGIVNLRTGRVDWVGQTCDPKSRFNGHRSGSDSKFKHTRLPIAYVKLGESPTRKAANAKERKFFRRFKKAGCCRVNAEKFRPFWNKPRNARNGKKKGKR